MKLIKLTRGLFAQVDDSDYDWLNQWKWYAHRNEKEKTFYAIRSFDNKKMHRLIMDTPANAGRSSRP